MSTSTLSKLVLLIVFLNLNIAQVIPILQLEEGEKSIENNVDGSSLNDCISVQRSTDIGVCFGKELLNKLNEYDETDSFSLATGVSFVRDEKHPRNFAQILDRNPLDFRAIMEDASELISKRSLQWDLSNVYPGLVMKIGPTLANGILEFAVDPRIKDRTYNHQSQEPSTGRLLTKSLLVPFLLGFKFQISTLLPLLLGLLLLATKKAFFLTKLAFLAITIFGGGFGSNSVGQAGSFEDYGSPLSSHTSWVHPDHHHNHFGSGGLGYYHRHPHHSDYFYKSSEQTTGSPISPDELRDRLERLFVTNKKDNGNIEETKEEDHSGVRNARNFAWTPINSG